MTMNPVSEDNVLDIKVEVILHEKGGVTTTKRNVYLGYPEPLQDLKTAVDQGASEEGARTMNLLKQRVKSLL